MKTDMNATHMENDSISRQEDASHKLRETAKRGKKNALLDIFWTRAAMDKFALLKQKQNARSDTEEQMPGED